MQPENTQLNIVTIINDTDNLISRINAHLEELENMYNIEGKKAPAILDGTVLKA
jgi:glutaredoxin 2